MENSLNETQLRQSGLGFLLLLVTPIFIVTMISVGISIGAGYLTKEPIISAIAFLGTLTVFSILQLFPIWLVVILIVVVGLIFSKMFLNLIRGG